MDVGVEQAYDAAIAGIAVGGVLQRRGPRALMTAGSVTGAVALALVAVAPTYPVFLDAWLLAPGP